MTPFTNEKGQRRLMCAVPHCRGTRGDRKGDPLLPGMEWICSKHWRLVAPGTKRKHAAARRAIAKADMGNASVGAAVRARAMAEKAWGRCKDEAISGSMGYGL